MMPRGPLHEAAGTPDGTTAEGEPADGEAAE
jgi:hypothetical protein